MAKSRQRKKAKDKKKIKNRQELDKKRRLKHYINEFEKYSKMAEVEKNMKRSAEMNIIRDWGESEETVTPTQQMLM